MSESVLSDKVMLSVSPDKETVTDDDTRRPYSFENERVALAIFFRSPSRV